MPHPKKDPTEVRLIMDTLDFDDGEPATATYLHRILHWIPQRTINETLRKLVWARRLRIVRIGGEPHYALPEKAA
ncbi:MAG: hypothetical protein JWQ49_98 [Edaphobacter sp.]|nr:hypothetical protein [Edaphobacter sp.]